MRAKYLTRMGMGLAICLQACSPLDEVPQPPAEPPPAAGPAPPPSPQMTADLSSPAGVWEGSIDFPGMPMVLMISLIEGADGQWQGVLEAPTGGAAPPGLEDLSVRGRVVSFRAPVGSDTLRVEGVMSADGRFLVGDATRASVTGSLGLRRRAAPAAAP